MRELARLDRHREIIAAEMTQQGSSGKRARYAGGRFTQHLVASVVAEQIVHVAESVEVDVQQCQVRALADSQELLQATAEQILVGQPGQRIEGGRQAL